MEYAGYVLAALTLFSAGCFASDGVVLSEGGLDQPAQCYSDYFRQQFYDTGNLFPEFAMNLGGGQNIYNYSYYGLYSPLFCCPTHCLFVKMSTYVIVMEMLCLMASVLLLYLWLNRKGFGRAVSFAVAVIFC